MKKIPRDKILLAILFFLILLPSLSLSQPEPGSKLKALVVTGQNSHDWERSSLIFKQLLEDTGLFAVDLAVTPPPGSNIANFSPGLFSYQLVILDYNGESWPSKTQRAFVDYVRNGGGVVVYHNSANAFPDWIEYGKIIGLAGKRDESDGPYRHLHAFPVQVLDSSHPITAGLPPEWMHASDELYGLLRRTGEDLEILATAYSDPGQSGSGRHEPVLFTVGFGKGRVFHTVLGHLEKQGPASALECAGFIVTFQRGAEWAASGRVTQQVPGDFPGVNRDKATPDDVRLWPGFKPPSLEEILKEAASYKYGQDEGVLFRLRDYVLAHKDSAESRMNCEERLLSFLDSRATLAAKMAVCRNLRLIGGERSVPVLEKMLLRPETSDIARFALEGIPGERAAKALLRALAEAKGKNKIGIISSLGNRKVSEAVAPLSGLIGNSDKDIALAAAAALGQVSNAQAAAVLTRQLKRARGRLQVELASSLLRCAAENPGEAATYYGHLLGLNLPEAIHKAALKGKIEASGNQGRQVILGILEGKKGELYEPAIGMVREVFDDDEIPLLFPLLHKLPSRSQAQLIGALSRYPREKVLSTVVASLKSEKQEVRLAALRALERLGDASSVELLVELAARASGEEQATARNSLWNLKDPEVDQAILLHLVKSSDTALQRELVRSIGERRIGQGISLLFDRARSSDPALRFLAIKALKTIASVSDLPQVLDLLVEARSEQEQAEIRTVLAAVAEKISSPRGKIAAVRERLALATETRERCALYRALGSIGEESSLPLLRQALTSKNSDVYDAAARSLIDWPNSAASGDLLWVAETAENKVHRVLALRAFITCTGRQEFLMPRAAVQSFLKALALAERPEEKRLVLGLLPRFPCLEAVSLAQSLQIEEGVQAEALMAAHLMARRYLNPAALIFPGL